jgi:urease accessory protein
MSTLLYLLQLASPSLPVGAYSYSEAIETLVSQEKITDAATLERWIRAELKWGSIGLDVAIISRLYSDSSRLDYWNSWLSAVRETQELKEQSHQMGFSLLRLISTIEPTLASQLNEQLNQEEVNFAITYSALASYWQIPVEDAILGYLHSWVSNLVAAGLKLIPLGQSEAQKILLSLAPNIIDKAQYILTAKELPYSCSWGLSLASMEHANLYSRLFRS